MRVINPLTAIMFSLPLPLALRLVLQDVVVTDYTRLQGFVATDDFKIV